jgi:hypothetical protein
MNMTEIERALRELRLSGIADTLSCVFRGIVTADFGIVTGHSGAS